MKRHSEELIENAIKVLQQTLSQAYADTGAVLDMYEDVHDDTECEMSRQYKALVAGHYALKAATDKINYQLNK